MATDAPSRKLAARRRNERVRLFASTLNTIALSIFGASFVLPAITQATPQIAIAWLVAAALLHGLAHWTYDLLRSED
jgi:hypothetical protein